MAERAAVCFPRMTQRLSPDAHEDHGADRDAQDD